MTNPVDDYLDHHSIEKDAAARDKEDMRLYSAWQQAPKTAKPKQLESLVKRFQPEIDKRVRLWKAEPVEVEAFKADLRDNLMTAFDTFDPNRGATLRTHATNMMKRSQRFNSRYQNVANIPEEKRILISPVSQAHDLLTEQLGKPPTPKDISRYLNENPNLVKSKRLRGRITPKLVTTVQKSQIRDIPAGSFESDPTANAPTYSREVLNLMPSVLKGEEKTVFNYLYGQGGYPQVTSTGDIAKRMGKNPSQVSRIIGRIKTRFNKHAT